MLAFRTALQVAGIQVNEAVVYLIGSIYKEMELRGDELTIKDIERLKREAKEIMKKEE